MVKLASEYGRYGYRRLTAMLRREGWRVNHKRIERLWRREGRKVPSRQPKRKRLWLGDGSCVRLRPAFKNHVWSYNFVHAQTHDGRPLWLLTLIDEFSRECLAIDVAIAHEKRTDVVLGLDCSHGRAVLCRFHRCCHAVVEIGFEFIGRNVVKCLMPSPLVVEDVDVIEHALPR